MKLTVDEGMAFGLGAFETIAVEKEKPVFLEAHLKRLEKALDFLEIKKKVSISEVMLYLKAHPMAHGVLKIMVSQENLLFFTRKNPYGQKEYEKGFVLGYSQVFRNESSPLTYHKTFNYGECILEKRRAKKLGLDDFVFLNSQGMICESTSSNIFFEKKGKLYSPALECGLLPGVIRGQLYKSNDVEDAIIYPKQVKNFESCFVTNSLLGIMPVRQLGEHVFSEMKLAD